MSPLLLAVASLALLGQQPAPTNRAPSAPTSTEPAAGAGGELGPLPVLTWADVDGDGQADALGLRAGALTLWLSGGGRGFTDVTADYGLKELASTAGAAFVDFDSDGRQDLFLVTAAGEARLLRNESGAAFIDATQFSGIASEGPILKAEWSDLQGNALPDLVVWTRNEIQVNTNLGGIFETHTIDLAAVSAPAGSGGWTGSARPGDEARVPFGDPGSAAGGEGPSSNGGEAPSGSSGGSGTSGFTIGTGWQINPAPTPLRPVGMSFPSNCAKLMVDLATQACINASSTPALGQLYPLSVDLNVEAGTGRVGMGTASPVARLHVVPGASESGILSDGSIEVREGIDTVARMQSYNGVGGQLDVFADNGQSTLRVIGQEATGNGAQLDFYTYGGTGTATLDAEQGSEGAALHLRTDAGKTTLIHDAQVSTRGAWSRWYMADGTAAAEVYAEDIAGQGGSVGLYNAGSTRTVYLDGESTGGGAALNLSASDGEFRQIHLAEASSSLGAISYYYASGNVLTLAIEAEEVSGDGSQIEMRNYQGTRTMTLDADDGNSASEISMYNSAGLRTVLVQAEEVAGDGAQIALYKADGTASIVLDASQGTDARITTETLRITGGADLVEHFETDVECAPGSVVSIAPAHPGELTLSSGPYDSRVAGIVSGAGNVKPGLHLGQSGVTGGDTPVALTGRVYVRCSDENGPVQPGDMLTSSSTPGVAMRATDPERSFGAVIGKAMDALEGESGLVLVLVGLQ
jgi:hypothetical protein